MILSIIQGLAFQDLAQRAAKIFPHIQTYPLQSLHLLLCFVVLLRILQTYIAVALDYEAAFVSFLDVVQIFAIGILQYCLFATLGNPIVQPPEPFHPELFYLYLGSLLMLAAAKYSFNTRLIDPTRYSSKEELHKEQLLQWQNAGGSIALAGLCLLVLILPGQPLVVWAAPMLAIGGLVAQTGHSLRKTFEMRAFVRQDWSVDSVSSTGGFRNTGGGRSVPRSDMTVRDGRVDDVDALTELAETLIPELAELLGVSRTTVSRQLRKLFATDHGTQGVFAWSNWRVVADDQGACVAAVLYLGAANEGTFLGLLAQSTSIVGGPTDGYGERADACGYLRPFREDKDALSAVFLVNANVNAAAAADAILDADYVNIVKGLSRNGMVFRQRGSDHFVVELRSLASSHVAGVSATTTEEYMGIGAFDGYIGSQVRMVKAIRAYTGTQWRSHMRTTRVPSG